MAYFPTNVLDNQIKALPTIATASGSIATFTTDKAENLVDCEVAIVATGGGGTPTTPIAINGFSACNLSVNGTTETIPFGQTVYGGRLNVGSGVLTVTHGCVDLGSLSWRIGYDVNRFITSDLIGLIQPPTDNDTVADVKCSIYSPISINNMINNSPNNTIAVATSSNLSVLDTRYSSETDFKTAMNGIIAVYELATPITIQLDSKQIQTIANSENNIWSDTGDISVQFILSVGSYVNQNV